MKKQITILLLLLLAASASAQNRPYIDDKPVHFGFSLGVNFMHYSVKDSELPFNGEIYHARISSMLPGFSVGFIADVRLSRHLNLRFCPGMHFGERTLTYKSESGNPIPVLDRSHRPDQNSVLCIPISVPLYLKWSAEREINYRPYLIAGGGISYDFNQNKDRTDLLQRPFDFFVEVGAGCDFYFNWFKLCPQLTYSIGFNNVLTPTQNKVDWTPLNPLYTDAISRLLNRQITLTFNFE